MVMRRQDKILGTIELIVFALLVWFAGWRIMLGAVALTLGILFVLAVMWVAIDAFWTWYTKD
jgi:hypothetical protein